MPILNKYLQKLKEKETCPKPLYKAGSTRTEKEIIGKDN